MGKNIKICQCLRMYMYIRAGICVDKHVCTRCCVLNVKRPPSFHVFEHVLFSYWSCFGTVAELSEADPLWMKGVP